MATYPCTGKTEGARGSTYSVCRSIIAEAIDPGSLASLTNRATVLLIAIAWLVIAAGLSTIAQERDGKTSGEIHQWIEQLGSPDYQVREAATKRLLQTGQEAVPPLKLAAADRDRERAERSRMILATILGRLDVQALQGKWKYVSIQLSGKPEEASGLLVIQDGTMTIRSRNGKEPFGAMKFSIDAGQTPKRIDFVHGKSVIKGLYRLDGDALTLCYPYDRDGPRPRKIETTAGDGMRLHVLTRVTQ